MASGALPQWYESQIRNEDGQGPLSYYSKALIDGNYFEKIDWDMVTLGRLVGGTTDDVGSRTVSDKASGAGAFKSHLKLARVDLETVVR